MGESQVTKGFFVLDDAGLLSDPLEDACAVLQTTSANGRTAGTIYVYKGDGVWQVLSGGGGNIFFQDADPGAVGVNAIWVNLVNDRIGIRDLTNTSWSFFSTGGGIGAIGSTGYGLGGYGDVAWDETIVNSTVYTTTPSLGLLKPMYATVGWGTGLSINMDKIEALNVRLLAVEAAVL